MANVEQAVRSALEELTFVVTKGLSPDQAEQVLREFRDTILPFRMRGAAADQDSDVAGRIEVVVEDYAKRFAGSTPERKISLAKLLSLQTRLEAISEKAFAFALAKARREEFDKAAAIQALASLQSIVQDVEASPQDVQQVLVDQISETSLDLRYALGAGNMLSLRLHRAVGLPEPDSKPAEPSTKQCGECGKVVEADVAICPRCGVRFDAVASNPEPVAAEPVHVQVQPPVTPPTQVVEAEPIRIVQPEPVATQPIPRFCEHCGAPLTPGKKFCTKCGKPVMP